MSIASTRSSHASVVRRSLGQRTMLRASRVKIDRHSAEAALRRLLLDDDVKPVEEIARSLRDGFVSEPELRFVVDGLAPTVLSMGPKTRLLVEALHLCDWTSHSQANVDAFAEFSLSLLTAQPHHVVAALDSLTKKFSKCTMMWVDDPSEEQLAVFSRIHKLIANIVLLIPLSKEILLQCAIDNYPYYKQNTSINRSYLYNMLWMTRYLPSLSSRIFSVVINRLIIMDVNLRRHDTQDDGIFQMELEDNFDELTECLDSCMAEVFKYIKSKGSDAVDLLFASYKDVILPTYGTRSIQFLVLYCLALRPERSQEFFDSLWSFVASARIGQSFRQAAIVHLTGLLARASFVTRDCLEGFLARMAEWCRAYVQAHEVQRAAPGGKDPHVVFHCVCQSLFYLIAFNQRALFAQKRGVLFVESLNLPKIIMSSLNPLRFCHAGIAETFTSVTRMHQVVYCNTVMEHNQRHYLRNERTASDLQEWFPFDPYSLPKSYKFVEPIYRTYEETLGGCKSEKKMEACDEDDFLAASPIFASRSLNSIR